MAYPDVVYDLLHPYVFERIAVKKPWAGKKLGELYPIQLPPGTGECIEVADNDDFRLRVAEGAAKGKTFSELVALLGAKTLLGNVAAKNGPELPLMLKLIDTSQNLSIQVHPDDRYENGKLIACGKAEAWVVLHAEPGACIWQGAAIATSSEATFWQAMRDGTPMASLHRREVKRGDCILSPAGMVHAIGPGLVLAELQQNSNVTYRIYDWGRHNNRELHIEEAKRHARLELSPSPIVSAFSDKHNARECVKLCESPHFTWCSYRGAGNDTQRIHSFQIMTCIQGAVHIGWKSASGNKEEKSMLLHAPGSALIPAGLGSVTIEPHANSWLLSAYPAQ